MDPADFPPNSRVSKEGNPSEDDRNVSQITSGGVIRKKRSLGRQFKETFIAGDVRGSLRYTLIDHVFPSIQDMIVEGIKVAAESIFRGNRTKRGMGGVMGGIGATLLRNSALGNVQYEPSAVPYNHMAYRGGGPARTMSRLARAQHNFDEIVMVDRLEAENVVDRMFEIVGQYGSASVSDLYQLVGISPDHTDEKWGWTDLRGASVTPDRRGYLIDLPQPIPF